MGRRAKQPTVVPRTEHIDVFGITESRHEARRPLAAEHSLSPVRRPAPTLATVSLGYRDDRWICSDQGPHDLVFGLTGLDD